MKKTSLLVVGLMIVAAALMRLAIYPANFSPVIAMALFGGAVIADKKLALLLPLLAMFISDLAFEISGIADGFWGWEQMIGYGILALIAVAAFTMKRITALNVLAYSVGAALLFYALSNFSVWLFDSYNMYPNTLEGLQACMAAGIPFIKNTLLATLLFSGVLFGGYVLLTRQEQVKTA